MKSKILIFGVIFSLITISCSKKEANDTTTINADEASVNAKIDIATEDVARIVEEQLTTNDGVSGRVAAAASSLPTCATVTRVPVDNTSIVVGDLITKTIDFGTTDCQLTNGNKLRGKIIMSHIYQPNATSHTVTYTFVDFYHNARKFNGTKTFVRTMTAATAASPSHPIVVMNLDMTMTLPDGRVFTRIGTRTREIIAGYDTPLNLYDNEYSVTGSWTTTYPNTTVQNSIITSPLIVKLQCSLTNNSPISKGIITFTRNTRVATLDYGNGSCDNTAIFTLNGVSYTIVLGN
ncbi:MAG: hypothetical protein H7174_03285 [Flavobacterium sp.]|nr:hypothetical protein [Flavobacterium sp.]